MSKCCDGSRSCSHCLLLCDLCFSDCHYIIRSESHEVRFGPLGRAGWSLPQCGLVFSDRINHPSIYCASKRRVKPVWADIRFIVDGSQVYYGLWYADNHRRSAAFSHWLTKHGRRRLQGNACRRGNMQTPWRDVRTLLQRGDSGNRRTTTHSCPITTGKCRRVNGFRVYHKRTREMRKQRENRKDMRAKHCRAVADGVEMSQQANIKRR